MNKIIIAIVLLLGPLAWMVCAQNTTPIDSPGTGDHRPPAPPIFTALDTNHDGIISASEFAKASAALKTLDKNGDGKLTPDEYKPPRQGNITGPDGSIRPACPPRPDNAPGQDRKDQQPPKPPIDTAFDTDKDDIISASEIAKASAALKTLDKNGDGKLTPDECLPPRPKMPTNNQTKG